MKKMLMGVHRHQEYITDVTGKKFPRDWTFGELLQDGKTYWVHEEFFLSYIRANPNSIFNLTPKPRRQTLGELAFMNKGTYNYHAAQL